MRQSWGGGGLFKKTKKNAKKIIIQRENEDVIKLQTVKREKTLEIKKKQNTQTAAGTVGYTGEEVWVTTCLFSFTAVYNSHHQAHMLWNPVLPQTHI